MNKYGGMPTRFGNAQHLQQQRMMQLEIDMDDDEYYEEDEYDDELELIDMDGVKMLTDGQNVYPYDPTGAC